jgi:GntR family transcriptional regulator
VREERDLVSQQALYSRLEELIRERIESREWPPGKRLPSERELSRQFGTSRMTTRKALDRLVAQGVLQKAPRRGTFVAHPKSSFVALTLRGFTRQAIEAGAAPTTSLLRFDRAMPSKQIAQRLGIAPSQLVYLIDRLRIVDGTPIALHQSRIPMDLAPALEQAHLERDSLYEVLASTYGLRVGHAEETLQSGLASEYEAVILGIRPGAPTLLLDIRLTTEQGRFMEVVRVTFRGDKVMLTQEI